MYGSYLTVIAPTFNVAFLGSIQISAQLSLSRVFKKELQDVN